MSVHDPNPEGVWRVETPRNHTQLRDTLNELHAKGYEVFSIHPYTRDAQHVLLVTAKKEEARKFKRVNQTTAKKKA
jgi:hypothetical protein